MLCSCNGILKEQISLRYNLELIHITPNCLGLAQQLCHFPYDERPALKRKILVLWQIDLLTHCWEMPQAVVGSAAGDLIGSSSAYLALLVFYEMMVKPLWQGSLFIFFIFLCFVHRKSRNTKNSWKLSANTLL